MALIQDPAELLYQAWSKAQNHRGPRGVALKLWHELANMERKAWRFAFKEMQLLLAGGKRLIAPAPEPGQVLIVIAHDGQHAFKIVDRDEVRTITQFRSILGQLDLRISEAEGEAHHE